jgi:hypothetical protein
MAAKCFAISAQCLFFYFFCAGVPKMQVSLVLWLCVDHHACARVFILDPAVVWRRRIVVTD